MKVLTFLDHDIMLRHFLLSGALSKVLDDPEAALVVPGAPSRRISMSAEEIGYPRLFFVPESPTRRFQWMRLHHVNRLRWRPGAQAKYLRFGTRRAIGPRSSVQYSVLALPGVFQALTALSFRKLRRDRHVALEELLDAFQPEVVLHPSVLDGTYVNDLLAVCKAKGIPVVYIANSWDNISTMRYMHRNPDWLLVWGEQTHEHALRYLRMPPARVVKFGAAQFDVYRKPARIGKEEFLARNGLDPGKKIVLYAGSSKGLDETTHLDHLERSIDDGVLPDTMVLYRPHPWGDGGVGGEHLLDRSWKHVRIESTMIPYLEKVRAGYRGIYLADYENTRDVLAHIDALVSPLSTIILEAAMMGKPAMCFLPREEESMHFKRAAPLEHFRPMYESPDFVVARSMAELVPGIGELIRRSDDPATGARMRAASTFFVDRFDEPYADRLLTFLRDVRRSRPR